MAVRPPARTAVRPPAIIHRDYHPWNVLVDGSEDLWVLDWDWGVGDRCFDLAWTCTMLRRSGHSAFSAAVSAEYARQGGRPLDHLSYFEVLTTLRWLLNVLPAVDTTDPSDAEEQARFRAFVAEPVRRARALLAAGTGLADLLA